MVQEPEKQQEYLNAIQNKSVRIGNLINLLFEYVKLDSEGFALNGKTLDLCELLRENAAMLYAEMEENGMTLTADIPEETIPVWADELQLSRVVTNLLTNAMQHNPKGTRIGLFAYRELERIYLSPSRLTGGFSGQDSRNLKTPNLRHNEYSQEALKERLQDSLRKRHLQL